MGTTAIDFGALARQHGGTEAPATIDYDALAKQHGAIEGPGNLERFWKATGLPDTYRGLTKDFGTDGDWDPGTIVHNAIGMIGGGLKESGGHTVDAMDAASKGKFLEALGQGVVSIPFAGPMIDKFATHLEAGELPEAAGTAMMLFGPSILKAGKGVVPMAAAKAAEAAPLVRAAGRGAWEGATAPVATKLGFSVPASVAGLTGGGLADIGLSHLGIPHQVAPLAGAIAPAVAGAVKGVKAVRAARAAVPAVEPPVATPVAATAAPVVLPTTLEPPTPAEVQAMTVPPAHNVGDLIKALQGIAARKATPAGNLAPAPIPASVAPLNVAEAITGMAKEAPLQEVSTSAGQKPTFRVPQEAGVSHMEIEALNPEDFRAETNDYVRERQGGLEHGGPNKIVDWNPPSDAKPVAPSSAPTNVAEALTGKYDPYAALHDARRAAKVDKVMQQFQKYGFTAEHVDKISDTQWKAVAQAAGISDLTPTQIEQVKARFKE